MSQTAILITHHLDLAKPHLKRCIDAVLKSSVDADIFVTSDAPTPILQLPGYERIKFIEDKTLDTTAKKNAAVFSMMDTKRIDTIVLVSDDIVVSGVCLDAISRASRAYRGIVAPLTNTELGNNVITSVALSNGQDRIVLKDRHTVEEMDPYLGSLSTFRGPQMLVRVPWVSFACVAMPAMLYAELGGVDPELEYRHNDQYFCMNAFNRGIGSFIDIHAFALHYGSVTIENIPGVDRMQSQCSEAFYKKIAKTV